jgi:hypothetical protein
MDRAKLLMHPVRMRMILLLGRRAQTVQQLSKELPDVATPTIYHHLNLLMQGQMVQVVKEQQKRGTIEKTYGVVPGAVNLDQDELAQTSHDDLMLSFQIFVSGLLGDYAQYLQQKDGTDFSDMGFHQFSLFLDDGEFHDFTHELKEFLQPWLDNQPNPTRRRRILSTIVITERILNENNDTNNFNE